MSARTRLAAAVLAVLTAGACASLSPARTGSAGDSAEIRDQLFKLQKDSARMLAKLDGLESAAGDDGALATCAEAAARISEMDRRLAALEEQSIASQQRLEQTLAELRALRTGGWTAGGAAGGNAGTSVSDWGAAAGSAGSSGQQAPVRGPAAGSSLAPEDLFNAAYADYSRGKNELALAGFDAAAKADPAGPLADDARYWMGETLLAMGRHAEAARTFDRVLTEFPDGSYVKQAHLKKGLALLEARRTTEGVMALQHVIETWPESDEARIAREYARQKGILQE